MTLRSLINILFLLGLQISAAAAAEIPLIITTTQKQGDLEFFEAKVSAITGVLTRHQAKLLKVGIPNPPEPYLIFADSEITESLISDLRTQDGIEVKTLDTYLSEREALLSPAPAAIADPRISARRVTSRGIYRFAREMIGLYDHFQSLITLRTEERYSNPALEHIDGRLITRIESLITQASRKIHQMQVDAPLMNISLASQAEGASMTFIGSTPELRAFYFDAWASLMKSEIESTLRFFNNRDIISADNDYLDGANVGIEKIWKVTFSTARKKSVSASDNLAARSFNLPGSGAAPIYFLAWSQTDSDHKILDQLKVFFIESSRLIQEINQSYIDWHVKKSDNLIKEKIKEHLKSQNTPADEMSEQIEEIFNENEQVQNQREKNRVELEKMKFDSHHAIDLALQWLATTPVRNLPLEVKERRVTYYERALGLLWSLLLEKNLYIRPLIEEATADLVETIMKDFVTARDPGVQKLLNVILQDYPEIRKKVGASYLEMLPPFDCQNNLR